MIDDNSDSYEIDAIQSISGNKDDDSMKNEKQLNESQENLKISSDLNQEKVSIIDNSEDEHVDKAKELIVNLKNAQIQNDIEQIQLNEKLISKKFSKIINYEEFYSLPSISIQNILKLSDEISYQDLITFIEKGNLFFHEHSFINFLPFINFEASNIQEIYSILFSINKNEDIPLIKQLKSYVSEDELNSLVPDYEYEAKVLKEKIKQLEEEKISKQTFGKQQNDNQIDIEKYPFYEWTETYQKFKTKSEEISKMIKNLEDQCKIFYSVNPKAHQIKDMKNQIILSKTIININNVIKELEPLIQNSIDIKQLEELNNQALNLFKSMQNEIKQTTKNYQANLKKYNSLKGKEIPRINSVSIDLPLSTFMFKILLIGSRAKLQFFNLLSGKNDGTMGSEFLSINYKYENGMNAQLHFWDTSGQERFQSIGKAFSRGTDCVVMFVNDDYSISIINKYIEYLDDNPKEFVLFVKDKGPNTISKDKYMELAKKLSASVICGNIKQDYQKLFDLITSKLENRITSKLDESLILFDQFNIS